MRKLILLCPFLLAACSTNKIAVRASAPLLYQASIGVESERDLEHFRHAVPGNLMMMEGMLSLDPQNQTLLVSLIKGYAGLAFAVDETDYFESQMSNKESEILKERAIINYTKAFQYGLQYLKSKNIAWGDIKNISGTPEKIPGLIDSKLSHDIQDLEAVMFTAQSLGGMINLQKDNILLVADLPIVKAMFDWTCGISPDINFGACEVFKGAYEAGRPKMLGGNPEKGKEIFLKAIEKFPHNWMIRTAYMQFYSMPLSDEESFKDQEQFLQQRAEEFMHFLKWSGEEVQSESFNNPRLRLYQAIAIKRFQLMQKYRKNLF